PQKTDLMELDRCDGRSLMYCNKDCLQGFPICGPTGQRRQFAFPHVAKALPLHRLKRAPSYPHWSMRFRQSFRYEGSEQGLSRRSCHRSQEWNSKISQRRNGQGQKRNQSIFGLVTRADNLIRWIIEIHDLDDSDIIICPDNRCRDTNNSQRQHAGSNGSFKDEELAPEAE